MNLRYEILRAVSKNPGAPAAEICDVIDYDRQKTAWSVRDCAKAGLLAMRRDDVTGQPGYTLTEAGKERLADGPTKQGGNAKHSQPAVEQNTGSSASGSLSPSEGAAVQSKPAPVAAATPSAAPVAADVKPPQYDPRSVAFSASTRLEAEKDEEYSLLGLLADIRAAAGDPEGKLMQDELVEHIRVIYDLGEAHKRACMEWETAMMAAVGEDGVNDVVGKIASLQHKISMQDAELFKQAAVVVDLRAQLETVQREAMRGATCLSGQDRYTAAGYLVRASKRKPRTLLDKDKARDAALSSIRAGAQRAEVFALVPIGHARRGAEWRSA